MSSARRCDPEAGFLVYLKTGSLHPVVGNHMDRRGFFKKYSLYLYYVIIYPPSCCSKPM